MALERALTADGKEKWNLILIFLDTPRRSPRLLIKDIDFEAKDDMAAKQKMLDLLKRSLKRIRRMRNRTLFATAAPYVVLNGREGLDGNRIIRNRRAYSNKQLLRVTKPDLALVQGFGTEALKKIFT
ncbi:MAG: hypothetical protein HYW91_01155 [Candidatus Sungbacteria bacterium]|nr:hypothetical protein [Candidatus Sungbacteria bacterium]